MTNGQTHFNLKAARRWTKRRGEFKCLDKGKLNGRIERGDSVTGLAATRCGTYGRPICGETSRARGKEIVDVSDVSKKMFHEERC